MKSPSLKKQSKARIKPSVIIWGSIFAVCLIVMGAAFYKSSELSFSGRQTSELASNMRLASQRMSTQALSAAQGKGQSFLVLGQLKTNFTKDLKLLEQGDSAKGLPPISSDLKPSLDQLKKNWRTFEKDLQAILGSNKPITAVSEAIENVRKKSPKVLALSEQVTEALRASDASTDQVYIATRQLMLMTRIENSLTNLLTGGDSALSAADQLSRDTELFSQVVDGFINGNKELDIKPVEEPETRKQLEQIVTDFAAIADNAGTLVEVSPVLFEVKGATKTLESNGQALFDATSRVVVAVDEQNKSSKFWSDTGIIAGVLAILAFIVMVISIYRGTRQQLVETEQANKRDQHAILTLLDEMAMLADGDLTVKTTVTEDITGAIADSVNYAIEAMRTLVMTINQAANNVADTSQETKDRAIQLSQSSEKQARKIVSVSDSIKDLTTSINKVSRNSEVSAKVAEQSLTIAHAGAETVRRTIEGMDGIRENIQDTSKRIKRLGESSQEIGDIVGLITDIAEQTNILALNAAIQASSASEGGRGFAVVADEVQRLAERAGNASKQIEALVRAIQADTNEAIQSMEKSTANVVTGARQASESGKALEEIESVSRKLAELIRGISAEAREQAVVSGVVAEAMTSIQEITRQTVESTKGTSVAAEELVEQAMELRKSIEGFRLPGDFDEGMNTMSVSQHEGVEESLDDFLIRA